MNAAAPQTKILHASAVAKDGRAMLILGSSGSGKSSLALQLIAFGATLLSDDRTALTRVGDQLIAAPGPNLAGLIEARQMGILTLPHATQAPVTLAVDLDRAESERLPPLRHITLLGVDLPLYRRAEGPHFAATLLHCLAGCRTVP